MVVLTRPTRQALAGLLDTSGIVYDNRYLKLQDSQLVREILLSFWKVHILHHAAEGTVYGQRMIGELRRHGYDISPGTLYPLLRRMESHGWLELVHKKKVAAVHNRREYKLTRLGAQALDLIQAQLKELYREVCPPARRRSG